MILINISMPKGCWSCPYFRFARCMAKSRTGRKIKNTWNLGDARQKWCPLIEIPKGAKLLDGNKLKDKTNIQLLKTWIDVQPTIYEEKEE